MRGKRAGLLLIAAMSLVVAACSGGEEAAPDDSTTTSAPIPGLSTTTTTRPGSAPPDDGSTTSTTGGDATSTTTSSPDPTGSTTSTSRATGTTTTTTRAPSTSLAPRPASQGCPQDLFVATGTRGPEFDTELAAFPLDGGEPLWRLPLGHNWVVSRTHDESSIYLFLRSGLLLALDAATCQEQWRLGLGTPGGVGLSEGVLVAADDRAVRAPNALDGSVLWSKDLTSGPPMAPLVLEDFAMVPRANSPAVTGYSVIDGARLYDVSLDGWSGAIGGITADFTAWYVVGNGRIAGRWIDDGAVLFDATLPFDPGPPRLFSGTLYVGGTGPRGAVIGAYDYDLGEEIWRVDLGGASGTSPTAPAIESGQVHVLDDAGRIHHLDLFDGSVISVGSYPASAVSAEFDDLLFLVAERGTVIVYTLDEDEAARLPTGADGAGRVTELDVVGSTFVTETYDG